MNHFYSIYYVSVSLSSLTTAIKYCCIRYSASCDAYVLIISMPGINLVPRSHSVLHLAVGDLGTRLAWDWLTSISLLFGYYRHRNNFYPCRYYYYYKYHLSLSLSYHYHHHYHHQHQITMLFPSFKVDEISKICFLSCSTS